jgi:site-specific DNA-methyltransferase (adenine-specific)
MTAPNQPLPTLPVSPAGSPTPYFETDLGKLYLGDCLEVMGTLPEGSVDLVLTDPPYSSGARRDAERSVRGSMLRSMEDTDWFSHDAMTTWGFTWFIRSAFVSMRKVCNQGSHVYCFLDWRQTPNLYAILESTGYRVNHCLVWRKTTFGMGSYWRNQHENIIFASVGTPLEMASHGEGSVLDAAIVRNGLHPTEKPVSLIEHVITASGRESLLDPFFGSGTTAVACEHLNRRWIGIEIEERYCEIAAKRILAESQQEKLFTPKQEPMRQESLL